MGGVRGPSARCAYNVRAPALAAGWLAFVSDPEKRRLPQFPSQWLELPDDEMHKLLGAALIALAPTRTLSRPKTVSTAHTVADSPAPPPVSRPSGTREPAAGGRPGATRDGTTSLDHALTPSILQPADIKRLVHAQARQARQEGIQIIEGMLGVKRALLRAGADISPQELRRLRRLFVDTFYFAG